MSEWYYAKSGSQMGPVSKEVLVSKISSGEIYQSDRVWREGMADWLPVSNVPELAATLRASRIVTPNTPVTGAVPVPVAGPGPLQMNTGATPNGQIPSYLWQSIVATFLCCLPLGIPAIIYASKVDSLLAKGDAPGAMLASKNAKLWCYITVGVGLLVLVVSLILGASGLFAAIAAAASPQATPP